MQKITMCQDNIFVTTENGVQVEVAYVNSSICQLGTMMNLNIQIINKDVFDKHSDEVSVSIKSFLDNVVEESKKYNEELIHRCNTLQNDLKKHMDILNIFEKNAQNSQKELLNSIASKLKCEYIDFKSAKNMPMTVDLGENLRDQINTIFQLLKKNGISVKEKERSKEKEIVKK